MILVSISFGTSSRKRPAKKRKRLERAWRNAPDEGRAKLSLVCLDSSLHSGRWNNLSPRTRAALLCHYYVLNTQFGHYFVKNTQRASPYYDPDARNGVIVHEFFARLAEIEQQLGSRQGIQLTADKINDWPISIDTTVASPPSTLRLSHRARVFAISLALVALLYGTRRMWMPRLPRRAPS
jgi:hypothetical protein